MKGFTIFFAMLVGSLSLAIGLAIYDLTIRELDLSATATQSQYAIYAADAGAECVLYWDAKWNGNESVFPTSTQSTLLTSGATCLGQDIIADGTPLDPYEPPSTSWTNWVVTRDADWATTTFTLGLGSVATSACAVVDVGKEDEGGAIITTIVSRGFNVCSPNITPRVERRFEIRY